MSPPEGREISNSKLASALASKASNRARLEKNFCDLDRDCDCALSFEEWMPFARTLAQARIFLRPPNDFVSHYENGKLVFDCLDARSSSRSGTISMTTFVGL